MKIKLGAVIPTVQYGNLQPEFELDENDILVGKDIDYLEGKIQELWNKYADKPLNVTAGTPTAKRVIDFFGNEIDWDEENHVYSWNGEKYLSGSEYAKSRQKPFNPSLMSSMVAKKFEVDPKEIAQLWERGGKISRDFGTTVHEALEVYGKFKSLSESVEKEYHIPNHPMLKKIVESFYEGRDAEQAHYEVLVVDHGSKKAGTIDRLLLQPGSENSYVIQDFKITHKEDKEYWKDQLTFYQGIIEANGGIVVGKQIFAYNGGWKEHKV